MREPLLRHCWPALLLCALAAAPAQAYVALDRWDETATNGFLGVDAWGTPTTITWSLAPDGTIIPSLTESNLISFLDANWGAGPGGADFTQRPWFFLFEQSFARLGALSGVTYVYEPNDDGVSGLQSFSNAQTAGGMLGVRGDVRIGGKSFSPDNTTLAANYFPDYGEMMVNTDQASFYTNDFENYRNMRNTIMHEAMHGLGVSHVNSSDGRFLLEPVITAIFDGPQLDDVLALQRLYGDALEKDGGNDAFELATPLGPLTTAQPLVRGTLGDDTIVDGAALDFVSIDNALDADYFRFTLNEQLDVSLTLTPKGTTYLIAPEGSGAQEAYDTRTLNDLALTLFDSTGVQQLGATADMGGLGAGEAIQRELWPGTYYARVTGSQNDVQLYQLAMAGAPPSADNLTWVGALDDGAWNVTTTANFHNGDDPDVFRPADHVVFNDAATTTTVVVAEDVAPATMTIDAAKNYTFTGPGSIATANLTVAGGGSVLLANSGNALGNIDVQSGTLLLSGVDNAPLTGVVHVAEGAAIALVSSQPIAEEARITGSGWVVGDLATPGVIAPGDSAGTLSLTGDLTLTAASIIEIEIGGLLAGSQHDVLSVAGTAALDGALQATLVDEYSPKSGDLFSVLTASALDGEFADLLLPILHPGLHWNAAYQANELVLSVGGAAIYDPADFNEDGTVDASDLAAWSDGFGENGGATHGQGDANGDMTVDGADLLVWQQRLLDGVIVSVSTLGLETPEPRALGLAWVATTTVCMQRRRPR